MLTGTIKEWSWHNPHTWLYLRVPALTVSWTSRSLESAPPAYLARQGWSETTLTAGESFGHDLCLIEDAGRIQDRHPPGSRPRTRRGSGRSASWIVRPTKR